MTKIFGERASDLDSLLDPNTPAAGHKRDWIMGGTGKGSLFSDDGNDFMAGDFGLNWVANARAAGLSLKVSGVL